MITRMKTKIGGVGETSFSGQKQRWFLDVLFPHLFRRLTDGSVADQ